jgi:beta-galactosidase/beta-glucuronidase
MARLSCTVSFFVRAGKSLVLLLVWLTMAAAACAQGTGSLASPQERLDLTGEWQFAIDSLDQGVGQRWFVKDLTDKNSLPGSMTTNGKGNNISLKTPWTGQIVDSSWFFKPEYAAYRQPGNIKVPFWLQPVKYYKGAAWYQKTIDIPTAWAGRPIELYLERAHWETTVWLDDQPLGMQNSLGTAHVVDLGRAATPGRHRLTVRVDNRVKDFNVGQNSHSISDHTQSNWNGLVGQLYLAARPQIYVVDTQLFPDVRQKQVVVRLRLRNTTGKPATATLDLQATLLAPGAAKLPALTQKIRLNPDTTALALTYPLGAQPQLWSEFKPNRYQLTVQLDAGKGQSETQQVRFGMREIGTQGTQFTINGTPVFMRGTLECAIFPKTGYPPTDVAAWQRIFATCKTYGLNHLRFHSWCPPEAAFTAADQAGMYLQIECSSWANRKPAHGARLRQPSVVLLAYVRQRAGW